LQDFARVLCSDRLAALELHWTVCWVWPPYKAGWTKRFVRDMSCIFIDSINATNEKLTPKNPRQWTY